MGSEADRIWVLKRTAFADWADEARLLHKQMQERRSARAGYWWRSYYTESCRCLGCSGRETDLLAIFEASGHRFALHVEVKHPRDKFKPKQAEAYPVRAQCWAAKAPPKVLPHQSASAAVIFSEASRNRFKPHLRHFNAEFTFEELSKAFPRLMVTLPRPT